MKGDGLGASGNVNITSGGGPGGGSGVYGGGNDLHGVRSGSTNPLTGTTTTTTTQGNSKCDSSPESGNPMLNDLHYPSERLLVPNYHSSSLGIDDDLNQKCSTTTRKSYLEDTPSSISHDGTLKGSKGSRGQLARRSGGIFSNPFKTDREKMDQLTELLNQYSVHGIPEQMGLLSFKHDSDIDDIESNYRLGRDNSLSGGGFMGTSNNTNNNTNNNKQQANYDEFLYLEDHWRCIVTNWESMPKRLQNQQDAIWELLHTEVFYIKRLKVISDLFLACLCNLQSECLLNDIDTEKMFSNITEVYTANHYFWMHHLLPMLKASRESHQPLNPIILRDGFLKFEDIFHPYVKYCLEHSNCLQYVKEKHKESELFKAYVVWCETRKDCDRLRLMDLLVKPMQRLTKYSLLLKAILKKTEADDQKIALKQMNDSVERFVCRVDACLRRRHDQERLASIVSRIESYDALDSSNDEVEKVLKEFTRLNLTCPMPGCLNNRIRQLLLEGSGLKLRDSYTSSKLDVHCFLFTDILLICKSVGRKGDKVRVIRQPFLVDRMVTHELKDGSGFIVIYLNEFNVASAFFTLYTTETRTWLEHVKRSQDHYREAKQQSALYNANQSSLLYRSTVDGDDEDSDFPSTALLVTNTSPRSSRSSLMRSQSGSMDISDSTLALGSNSMIVPSTTPNLLSQNFGPDGEPLPSRAISFELGELRNPSMTVDDVEHFGRSHSMETRPPPIAVTITSPRPERRAFLLRGAGSERSYDSVYGSGINTLSVNVPSLHVNKHFPRTNETSIQVPVLSKQSQYQQQQQQQQQQQPHLHQTSTVKPSTSPPSSTTSSNAPRQRSVSPRSLQRSLPISSGYPAANKPPLVKMKNITGLKVHSAPPSEGPSPVHSFDSEVGGGEGCPNSSSIALIGVDTVDNYGSHLVSGQGTTISSSSVGYNSSIISISDNNSSDYYHHAQRHVTSPGDVTTMIINDPSGGGNLGIGIDDDLDTAKSRLHQKRSVRGERRYHTADSIENIKKEKDSSIHKRLSWNFGQQSTTSRGGHGGCSNSGSACGSGQSGGHDRVLCNKHFNKCLSSESVYTSSGFSSTGSVPLSVNSCECDHCGIEVLSHIQEMEPSLESQQPSPTIYDEQHHHSHSHPPPPSHSIHHQPHHIHSQSHQSNLSVTINERKDEEDEEERINLSSSSSSSPQKIIITDSSSNKTGTRGDADYADDDDDDDNSPSSKSGNPVIGPSDIKIDVSEVKDGISSVQITLSGTNIGKPSKSDLKKMKEFLLTSLEASEV